MDLSAFRSSIAAVAPPAALGLPLQALWWDAKGEWAKALACAPDEKTPTGAAVHASLHRVEGDLSTAGYWYTRAGRSAENGTLAAEWERLATELLGAC